MMADNLQQYFQTIPFSTRPKKLLNVHASEQHLKRLLPTRSINKWMDIQFSIRCELPKTDFVKVLSIAGDAVSGGEMAQHITSHHITSIMHSESKQMKIEFWIIARRSCRTLTSTCWSRRWKIPRTRGRGCRRSGLCPHPAEIPWATGCRGAASPSWTSGSY